MSEPLSAIEIEDVLSSIRRLVSEDLRPTHKLVSAALQNGAAKLILTPALRVVSNEAPGFVHAADVLDDPGDLRTVLDAIEATDSVDPVDPVPMFGSVRLQEMADVQPDGQADSNHAAADANFLTSAMSRINGLSAVDSARSAPPETIGEVVAAVGAAVGPDEWEVDGGEPAPQAKAWQDTIWNSTEQEDVAPSQGDAAADLALADPADVCDAIGAVQNGAEQTFVDVVEPANADDFAARELPPSAAVDQSVDLMGQDSIVFHADVLHGAIEAAELNSADDARHDADFTERDLSQEMDDAAGYLNEDLLREIVRDMIQAELQGTLGERITRNVRKLVRAEINRALAGRDYE